MSDENGLEEITINFTYEDLSQAAIDSYEANRDISKAHGEQFTTKWRNVKLDVPALWLDFEVLYSIIEGEEENEGDLLFNWTKPKIELTPIMERLGPEIAIVFVEWLELTRRATILQQINLHVSMGLLDLVMDEEGNISYVELPHEKSTPDMSEQIQLLIKAHADNF